MEGSYGLKLVLVLVLLAALLAQLAPAVPEGGKERRVVLRKALSFPKPRVIKGFYKGYDVVRMPGTRPLLRPGAPIVPVKVLTFKLPYNAVVKSVRVTARTVPLPGKYRLLPAPEPKVLQPPFTPSRHLEDPRIYRSSKPYPRSTFEYEVKRGIDPVTLKRVTYVIVRLFPVRYTPLTGQLEYVAQASVEVEYLEPPTAPVQGSVDLVVITSQALETAATTLAQWKNSTGFTAKVYTVEWIDANFQGADLQEKIRNFINYTVNNFQTLWVIILGDVDQVPVRRAYFSEPRIQQYAENPYVETDLYYADLQGTWDTDGDGLYGEVEDEIDGYPDVIVGRLPASTLDEANAIITKLMNYNPDNSWFRRILLLGTITFGDRLQPEGQILKDFVETHVLPENFSWTKLYEQLGNLTPEMIKAEVNQSYGFVNFAGHGYTYLWYLGEGGYFLNTTVYELANGYNTSVVLTMACLTADYGDTDVSIAEAFLIHSDGGAIAYFGAADVAWGYVGYWIIYGLAGEMDWLFLAAFDYLEDQGYTPTPGLMHVLAINTYLYYHNRTDPYDWYTVVEYGTLLGDPSLPLAGTGTPPPPPPTPVLKGYVLNETGHRIPAVVRLYNYTTGELVYEYNATDGYYEFVDIPYWTYTMEVVAEGYVSHYETFYYPRVVMEKNVTLVKEYVFPPNTVLVVVDDDASKAPNTEGVWPAEIKSAVTAAGFNAYLWNESSMGNPPLEVLQNENVTAVLWHTGTCYGYAIDSIDSENLIKYVEAGGRVLLEGEDIGFDHRDDELMTKVAHAVYEVDDAGVAELSVVRMHSVVHGFESMMFVEKPPYPDGVSPTAGGVGVAVYSGTDYYAIVVYDGVPEGNGSRTVYFAFPVHYLDAADREALIANALKWLAASHYVTVSTNASAYVPGMTVKIVASLLNWTEPVTGASVAASIYAPNGSLVGRVTLVDDGTDGDEMAGDGNYTGLFALQATLPGGTYTVVAQANVTGEVPVYGYTSFVHVVKPPRFEFRVVDVDVVSAVVRVNATVWNNASLKILAVKFCVDGGEPHDATPVDGAFDEVNETVHFEVDASSLPEGFHTVSVKIYADYGYASGWFNLSIKVRDLVERYNLIALSFEPFKEMYASDLARAVGPALAGVWMWDVDAQEFRGYVPGVSPPEEDFQILVGYGYFVYMTEPGKLVEVRL